MLCKLLAATRVVGNPGSLFHKPSIDAWLKYYKLDATAFPSRKATLDGIFDAARARGRGETDVFGLRLQRGSFAFFMDQLDFLYPNGQADVERIEAAFGQTLFIHLTREDKLDQAISYIRAEQTGLWHLGADGTEIERQEVRRKDRYDADAIRAQLSEFAEFDKEWRSWFDEQSINHSKSLTICSRKRRKGCWRMYLLRLAQMPPLRTMLLPQRPNWRMRPTEIGADGLSWNLRSRQIE